MKASLMIGDWVCYSKANNYYTRVNEIRHTDAPLDDQWYIEGMRSDNDKINPNAVEYFAVDILSPIPLTPEILTNNGFKCEEIIQCHWISEDGRILLKNDESLINSNNKWSVHVDNEDMQSIGYFEITYVHELQRALRMCGIEKEIII